MRSLLSGTRLTLFLPVNTAAERIAAARAIAMSNQRFGGSTRSSFVPATFRGYWLHNGAVYTDDISLVLADMQREASDRGFLEELQVLKTAILDSYKAEGSPQEELWMVISPVQRVA